MADERPLWKKLYDRIEKEVAPRLEAMVRTDQFADFTAVVTRLRNEMNRRVERASRQNLHAWNLPAGSDVKRLSEQVASLERRVRDLQQQLRDRDRHAASPPKTSRRQDPA